MAATAIVVSVVIATAMTAVVVLVVVLVPMATIADVSIDGWVRQHGGRWPGCWGRNIGVEHCWGSRRICTIHVDLLQ
jgi:hypothetical protein